ncbi:hypothetical protein TNCV_4054661 [Trichonephila clavipes]|nr:hypothetical protein TNCV_4054661 [Trichonephila clavipes]
MEEFNAVDDDNVCSASMIAEKDILEFVQSSNSVIEANFNDEKEKSNAAPVPTASKIVFQLDTLRENCGIIRKQASTDSGVLWKVMCVDVVQVRVAPHAILYQTLSEYLGKQLRLISGREILSLCTPPPAEAGVMWRVRLGSRVVGELICRYR